MDSPGIHSARIARVLRHIDRHLADDIRLEALAAVAHFSPWHFHRVFGALVGETLADYVRRRRVETAAQWLLTRRTKISDIALDTGFSSAEVLSRVFRAHFGVSPSAWRAGAWRERAGAHREQLRKIHQADRKTHQALVARLRQHGIANPVRIDHEGEPPMKVETRHLPATRVAYLRHVGPYGESGVPLAWQRFVAWCDARGLREPSRRYFGVAQDNPKITPPAQCRYDCCVEFDGADPQAPGIAIQTVAGGLYACARFAGTSLEVYEGWRWLCADWLPASGFETDERPVVEAYGADFGHDPQTGRLSFEMCLPVRARTGG